MQHFKPGILIGILAILISANTGCNKDDIDLSDLNSQDQLTKKEVSTGLKEALRVGIENAVDTLSRKNGYWKDSLVRIPAPAKAKKALDYLATLPGTRQLVEDFRLSLNRAAEDAADEALPIFKDAIKKMTITDARNILNGPDDAATQFFRDHTYQQLFNTFKPDIKNSLDKVNATKYWKEIASTYNSLPFVTNPVEVDLPGYTTDKALDGLFLKVEKEEKKIRDDPKARVNNILKKVFGTLDQ